MSHSEIDVIDTQVFRTVMSHYPTGVVIVTGIDPAGDVLAMVVGTFCSVSLDPPLVSFMPMKSSRTFERMQQCTSLCINVIGDRQENVVVDVARRWENKLEGIAWSPSPSGAPVLDDSVAWIDVRIRDTVDAGDHWIVLCTVRDLAVTNPVSPLLFFQGGYGSFVCTSLMARMDHEILPAIHAAQAGRSALEEMAIDIGCEVQVFTVVSRDEMAEVLSVTAPDVDRANGLSQRIPMVPPVGDTYVAGLSHDEQEKWLAGLHGADAATLDMHRERLRHLDQHGYAVSFLPAEGAAAYAQMRQATREYESGRLTPAQERDIRMRIAASLIDHRVREIHDDEIYDVASLVFPVRNAAGTHELTVRFSQLPTRVRGSRLTTWIDQATHTLQELAR
ncbi:flavin reductase family protein [Rhodococcus sp. USK13]|uniref:flavin reductase family protein n=1 Tax=Rhodococcus sp. USK13 TaxID=2806442 RepID=UPI001BD023BE|nr:flavin reductase family protein [Rhodococcus sp. USK13]